MEDIEIIDLFLGRDENAIKELSAKYHAYCHRIALNFVGSIEDAEECVNDTWLAAWSYMPPKRPANLPAFVGRITRGFAIDCLRKKYAAKRADLHLVHIEQETGVLNSLLSDPLEEEITARELTHVINNFLRSLPEADRDIFLRRYWYLDREKEIAARHGRTVNGIKASLYRSRKKLYKRLQAEKWISGKKGEHYESEAF